MGTTLLPERTAQRALHASDETIGRAEPASTRSLGRQEVDPPTDAGSRWLSLALAGMFAVSQHFQLILDTFSTSIKEGMFARVAVLLVELWNARKAATRDFATASA